MVEKLVCPKCGADKPRKFGHSKKGKQRLQCTNCGCSFMSPEDYDPPRRSGYTCKHCKSLNVIWYGRRLLTRGRQKRLLKCKDCNKTFYQPEETEG